MLEALIGSGTRLKVLQRMFLNAATRAYLRGLEAELGDSTNGIRIELNRLVAAGMLLTSRNGNRKYFQANIRHPLFPELNSMLRKHLGLQDLVEKLTRPSGGPDAIYLTGDLSRGLETEIVDLILVGRPDQRILLRRLARAEQWMKRKIRFILFESLTDRQLKRMVREEGALLLWSRNHNA
ncbi:MAG: ArsR family transcriptional regulator [Saprospiraceae bacterium]|nr:ArsR family transcriptional regulator [Saprospiraceae bacterium]